MLAQLLHNSSVLSPRHSGNNLQQAFQGNPGWLKSFTIAWCQAQAPGTLETRSGNKPQQASEGKPGWLGSFTIAWYQAPGTLETSSNRPLKESEAGSALHDSLSCNKLQHA